MKILVWIGTTYAGLDWACAGEQRYAMNVSHALALAGHDVFCSGCSSTPNFTPVWGTRPPIKNITFINAIEASKMSFDVSIYHPWEFFFAGKKTICGETVIDAKLCIHCSFGFNGQIDENGHNLFKCSDKDAPHIIAKVFPPNVDDQGFHYKVRLLPFPFYVEEIPLRVSGRNSVLWLCKGVFTDQWGSVMDIHHDSAKMLRALAELSNKKGAKCIFISGKSFESKISKSLGVDKIVNSIDNKILVKNTIDRNLLLDTIRQEIRFGLVVRGYFGGCFDMIYGGAIPLFHEQHRIEVSIPEGFHFKSEMSDAEVYDLMETYFCDDAFYYKRMQDIIGGTSILSYSSFYKYFDAIVEEFLGSS